MSDILPAGFQAVLNADIGPGSSVAIFGAGPVGLMAAACARMLGAEEIFMVDHHPYRLEFARETYGVFPINFDEVDPAEVLQPYAVRVQSACPEFMPASYMDFCLATLL